MGRSLGVEQIYSLASRDCNDPTLSDAPTLRLDARATSVTTVTPAPGDRESCRRETVNPAPKDRESPGRSADRGPPKPFLPSLRLVVVSIVGRDCRRSRNPQAGGMLPVCHRAIVRCALPPKISSASLVRGGC